MDLILLIQRVVSYGVEVKTAWLTGSFVTFQLTVMSDSGICKM